MRKTIWSNEFSDFYEVQQPIVQEKIDYLLEIVKEKQMLHSKIVKKLINTQFYELRITLGQEYRIIIYPYDHKNIIEAEIIILLNGFVKKSTKDYKRNIKIANNILKKLEL